MNHTKTVNDILASLKAESYFSAANDQEAQYIVYVDDESELLESVSETAAQFGFRSFCTVSVAEALVFIEGHQHQIAYILADYKMSPQTGFEFRESVSLIAPEIPFTILSGNITKELALKGLDLKISGFLDKPINVEKFADLMAKDGLPRVRTVGEDRELLQGFITEAETNLEQAEELALAFESNPHDMDAVNKCFGLVHTLKGASGYFKPKTLHHFIHRFEDLLKKIQHGEIALDPDVVSTILRSFDLVRVLLQEFRSRQHQSYDLESICKEYFESPKAKKVGAEIAGKSKSANEPPQKTPEKEVAQEIRVPVLLLDRFMQTSGEMTVIRNMINKCVKSIASQYPGNRDVEMLSELLDELHEVNGGVQAQITQLRKVPIHNILKPIHRVVRDVSKSLAKEAEVRVVGDELAVDTAIAGVLNNSLVHLIRNSLDHGLELPDDREKQGKSRKGLVTISSSQKNDVITVTIEDDGRGINEASIEKRLLKNGTHTAEQAARLSRQDLYAMIFESGFSTAEKVTDVSGRGVGMSMVKDSVKSVGGNIEIESHPGKGTKFILTLPVPKSVLIRDCLFVNCQGMQFGLPQDDVLRVLHISEENANQVYESQGMRVIEHEGHLVSIVNLSSLLALGSSPKSIADESLNLVLIGSGQRSVALAVDAILDIEDTVIKPLQGPSKKVEVFQGAAYMGDGTIGLILSSEGLLTKAHISKAQSQPRPAKADTTEFLTATEFRDLLLFRVGDQSLYAIPNGMIYRIEEINRHDVRVSGGQNLLPYRGGILNIISLAEVLSPHLTEKQELNEGPLQTIVVERKGHFFGLVVQSIDDIVRTDSELIPPISSQIGNAGHLIINDKTSTLINLDEIIDVLTGKAERGDNASNAAA